MYINILCNDFDELYNRICLSENNVSTTYIKLQLEISILISFYRFGTGGGGPPEGLPGTRGGGPGGGRAGAPGGRDGTLGAGGALVGLTSLSSFVGVEAPLPLSVSESVELSDDSESTRAGQTQTSPLAKISANKTRNSPERCRPLTTP